MSSRVEVWVVEVVNAKSETVWRGIFDDEGIARRVERDRMDTGQLVRCWNMMAKS